MSLPSVHVHARSQDDDKILDLPFRARQAHKDLDPTIDQTLGPGSFIEEKTTYRLSALGIEDAAIPRSSRLLRLSNELIIPIIAHTSHQDLINFALCCKLLHALARSALNEHKALMHKFGVQISNEPPRNLSNVLRNVIEEPRRELYVRQLIIRPMENTWTSSEPGERIDAKWILKRAKCGAFKQCINDLVSVVMGESDQNTKQTLLWSIAQGAELPLTAILLAILPNLTKLSIKLGSEFDYTEVEFLDLVLASGQLSTIGPNMFSNLKSVTVHCSDDDAHDTAFGLLRTCAHLPSMRTIVGLGIVLERSSKCQTLWDANVQCLILEHGALGENLIRTMVLGMKHWKQFTYAQTKTFNWENPRPDLKSILDALLDSARGTLEVLKVTGLMNACWNENAYGGRLLLFRSLREVTVEYGSLLKARDSGDWWSSSLYAQLSKSIRKVRLDCWTLRAGHRERTQIISQLLETNLDASAPSLPNLQYLEIACLNVKTTEPLIKAGYIDRFATAGMVLDFDDCYDSADTSSDEGT